MSDTSTPAQAGTASRVERYQQPIAVLVSVLLHVLALLVLLYSAQPKVTAPQGAASGSRVKVNVIGHTQDATPPPPSPPPTRPPTPKPPVRAVTPNRRDLPTTLRADAEPVQPPEEMPQQNTAQSSAAPPSPPARRRPETWTGRPPGLIEEDLAPENTGQARGPAVNRGDQRDVTAAEPSMEVGGYQVYYDLRAEELVRQWKAQGMTELFLPLPGTQKYMVCPLQTALNRASGNCRLLDPSSPEMQRIGDARKVITVMDVYRRGERVWRGPGAYR